MLHIAVLFFNWTSTQTGNLTAWNPSNGLCVLHRKSTNFKFTYVFFYATLRPKWRQFLLALHAKAMHASRRAACSHVLRTNLLRWVLEERVCAYVGSEGRSSSTHLTFSRLVAQQTLRTPREKANEGKMIKVELVICCLFEGGRSESRAYTLWGLDCISIETSKWMMVEVV